jgi:hypothetical protein
VRCRHALHAVYLVQEFSAGRLCWTEKSLPLRIATLDIESPLILAPMQESPTSAFDVYCSRFGGYVALFTSCFPLLLLRGTSAQSPFTKRR